MAAPTKESVLAELQALGVQLSGEEKMPELLEKLREAREAASAGAGDGANAGDGTTGTTPKEPEVKSSKSKRVMAGNVIHDGVSYTKGQEVSLSKELTALFESKSFLV